MDGVVQIITQVGFPIGMCILIWWDSRKREDQLLDALTKSTAAMTAQAAALDRLADAINNREV